MTKICVSIGSAALLGSTLVLMFAGPATAWAADGGANPVVVAPKANQVGYLPGAEKGFTIVAGGAVTAGSPFEVRSSMDVLVYSGNLDAATVNETAATGEMVLRGDFSSLAAPGTYVIVVG